MRKNNGFTLIELLAVLVILAIISVIVFPMVYGNLDNSKDKNEEIFKGRLTDSVESYITTDSNNFNYNNYGQITKGSGTNTYSATVYKVINNITLQNLIDKSIIPSPIKNPKNNITCSLTTPIEIYRDSDYVFCFKIINMDCLTLDDKSISTCSF